MLKRIKFRNEFTKNIFVLISGTGIAQAIPIAISPILTRIYSPNDFGLLGLYISICSMLGIIGSLRYDAAIIQADSDQDAKHLVIVSFIASFVFSFLLVIVLVFNQSIASILNSLPIQNWLLSIPFTVFLVSSFYIISFWLNKKKRFLDMSINRVINKTTDSVLSVLLGFLGFLRQGLLLGYIVGQFVMISLLIKKIKENDNFVFNKKRALCVARKYVEYPKYYLPSTILSEISSNVFLILISIYYGGIITGYYSLVFRVTYLPLGLIGNSIGEVYRQKANEQYLEEGNCKDLFVKTFKTLFLIGIIPFLILFFFSEYLFVFVFGSEWKVAGEIAKYFSFLIFFQFISTPLSFTIFLNKSQKKEMFLQLLRTIFTILTVVLGHYNNDYMFTIILMVVIYCIYYIFNSLLQYRAAIGSQNP